eukprot:2405279-Pyramimonas_sp.AAC.1
MEREAALLDSLRTTVTRWLGSEQRPLKHAAALKDARALQGCAPALSPALVGKTGPSACHLANIVHALRRFIREVATPLHEAGPHGRPIASPHAGPITEMEAS